MAFNQELIKGYPKWSGVKPTGVSDEQWFGALEYWIKSYEGHCARVKIENNDRANYLPAVLEPDAAGCLHGIAEKSWAEAVAEMKTFWGFKGGNTHVLSKITMRLQLPGEAVTAYAATFRRLCGLLVAPLADKPELQLPYFKLGLRREVRTFLLGRVGLDTIQLVVELVGDWEAEQGPPMTATHSGPMHAEAQVAFVKRRGGAGRASFGGTGRGKGHWRDDADQRLKPKSECYVCGQPGHIAVDCKYKARPGKTRVALFESSSDFYEEPNQLHGRFRTYKKGKQREEQVLTQWSQDGTTQGPLVPVRLPDGKTLSALVDTGASISCISVREARKQGARIKPSSVALTTADHSQMLHAGICVMSISVNGVVRNQELFCLDRVPGDLLLGRDAIAAWGVTILSTGEILFTTRQQEAVIAQQHQTGMVAPVTSKPQPATVQVVHRLRNDPRIIEKCHFGDALPHLKPQVMEILLEFVDVFAEDGDDFGNAKCDPMKITLKAPVEGVVMTPHRLPWRQQEFLDETITKWLNASPPRIRESTSKVAVTVHVVPKEAEPGGPPQLRLVTDFKPLNDFFESDNHPVGDAQRIFDEIGGDTVAYWKVDFAMAFLQMPMDEFSKYLTSFVTDKAQYEFNYCPYGLKSAPAKLQRELNRLFRGLARLKGYADDWLGAPTSEKQFLEGLRQFLIRVRQSGFLLKPSKCYFLYTKLKFMGRELTLTGYGPDMESKQALLKMKRPVNCKELEEYLGLARW